MLDELTNLKDSQVAKLEFLRDELNLKSHLFMAEVKDEWNKLEKEFSRFKSEIGTVTRTAERSGDEVKAASKLLLESLEKGYTRIKNSLS